MQNGCLFLHSAAASNGSPTKPASGAFAPREPHADLADTSGLFRPGAAAEVRLELNRALGEAWRAAGELSGLLLEEVWPDEPAVNSPAVPGPFPVPKKTP
jgi:hypothetical protein